LEEVHAMDYQRILSIAIKQIGWQQMDGIDFSEDMNSLQKTKMMPT
jgi:hypothetical protein